MFSLFYLFATAVVQYKSATHSAPILLSAQERPPSAAWYLQKKLVLESVIRKKNWIKLMSIQWSQQINERMWDQMMSNLLHLYLCCFAERKKLTRVYTFLPRATSPLPVNTLTLVRLTVRVAHAEGTLSISQTRICYGSCNAFCAWNTNCNQLNNVLLTVWKS